MRNFISVSITVHSARREIDKLTVGPDGIRIRVWILLFRGQNLKPD